jgi:hypothetical protein
MKNYFFVAAITAGILVSVAGPSPVVAGCTVGHWETYYECIEYYPNGKDCRKTVKKRKWVCDDFDVDRGGVDDANRRIRR